MSIYENAHTNMINILVGLGMSLKEAIDMAPQLLRMSKGVKTPPIQPVLSRLASASLDQENLNKDIALIRQRVDEVENFLERLGYNHTRPLAISFYNEMNLNDDKLSRAITLVAFGLLTEDEQTQWLKDYLVNLLDPDINFSIYRFDQLVMQMINQPRCKGFPSLLHFAHTLAHKEWQPINFLEWAVDLVTRQGDGVQDITKKAVEFHFNKIPANKAELDQILKREGWTYMDLISRTVRYSQSAQANPEEFVPIFTPQS